MLYLNLLIYVDRSKVRDHPKNGTIILQVIVGICVTSFYLIVTSDLLSQKAKKGPCYSAN